MTNDRTSPETAKAIQGVLEGWFGEAIENMDDEKRVRKYLLEPLIKAAQGPDTSTVCTSGEGK